MPISHDVPFRLSCGDGTVMLRSFAGVGTEALDQYERDWQPLLQQAGTEDAHWTWRSLAARRDSYLGLSLFWRDACQCMMLLKEREWMRGARDGGLACTYIAYFASAPWNRPELVGKVLQRHDPIKPLGSCLMLRAIEISQALGHEGRLAWHALPGSVTRYRAMFPRIVTTGMDMLEGLDWYEIGRTDAREFKRGMEPWLARGYREGDGERFAPA